MPALSGRKGEKRSAFGDFEVLAGGNEMGASKPVGLFDFAHRDPIDFCNLRESLARHHPVTGPRESAFRNRDSLELARRSEEHTSELQSQSNLVCRLLLEKTK